MSIKLNFVVASMLALAVSSQAFAQDNASQQPVPPAPAAAPANDEDHKPEAAVVPAPREATTQSLREMAPYAVAAAVIILAVAAGSGGGGSNSGTTGTTP